MSGAQKNIFNVLNHLFKLSEQASVTYMTNIENELTDKLRSSGINVIVRSLPREIAQNEKQIVTANPFKILRRGILIMKYNRGLRQDFKSLGPDVIWLGNIRTLLTVSPSLILRKSKIIWNIWSEPTGFAFDLFHFVGAILANEIHTEYSGQLRRIVPLHRFFMSKEKTVVTGVELPKPLRERNRNDLSIGPQSIVITNASNITPEKGQFDLLVSVFELLKSGQDITLLLCGVPNDDSPEDVSYFERIMQFIEANELSDRVKMLGWQPDMGDVFEMTDIYVHPSYTESLPVVIREAMGFKIPVIATNVGGTFELVSHGENGLLIEAGHPEQIESGLLELIANSELRRQFGDNGFVRFQREFDLESYVTRFCDVTLNLHR